MFAKFDQLRKRLTGAANKHHLTVENCGLTRSQIDVGQKAIKILGFEDPDKLAKHDVIIFLYAVGLNPTDDVIDSKFRHLKLHNNEYNTFADLCHIWHSMIQDLTDEEEILKRAFQFFDKDGNGEISVHELRNTMHELGDLLTEHEIQSFMEIMDVNNDGVIGYEEFLETLRTQAPDAIGVEEEQEEEEGRGSAGADRERGSGARTTPPSRGPAAEAVEASRASRHRHQPAMPVVPPTHHMLLLPQQPPQPALLQPGSSWQHQQPQQHQPQQPQQHQHQQQGHPQPYHQHQPQQHQPHQQHHHQHQPQQQQGSARQPSWTSWQPHQSDQSDQDQQQHSQPLPGGAMQPSETQPPQQQPQTWRPLRREPGSSLTLSHGGITQPPQAATATTAAAADQGALQGPGSSTTGPMLHRQGSIPSLLLNGTGSCTTLSQGSNTGPILHRQGSIPSTQGAALQGKGSPGSVLQSHSSMGDRTSRTQSCGSSGIGVGSFMLSPSSAASPQGVGSPHPGGGCHQEWGEEEEQGGGGAGAGGQECRSQCQQGPQAVIQQSGALTSESPQSVAPRYTQLATLGPDTPPDMSYTA